MAVWRPWSAAATCLGVVIASQIVLPNPASAACSCVAPKVDAASAAGRALAVVTRLDDGDGPRANFAVEASYGAEMPPRVSAHVDDGVGANCRPWVDPRGGVAAVVFNRELLSWDTEACGTVSQEEVFQQVLGTPQPIAGGPAVAVASGRFGGANLVAVDANGTPVAWGSESDGGGPLAACPSGTVVAALDRAAADGVTPPRLTVHLLEDLTLRHAVPLPLTAGERIQSMRCTDRVGDLVELLVTHDQGLIPARLMSVREGRIELRDVGELGIAHAVSNGFLAVHGFKAPGLARVVGGVPVVVTENIGMSSVAAMAVSADETTVALWGKPTPKGGAVLRLFDLRTGSLLATRKEADAVTGLAWMGDELLVRVAGQRRLPAPAMKVLDRALRSMGHVLTPTGHRLSTIAGSVLTFGGARATLSDTSGRTRALPMVRLAAAEDIVGVPGRYFEIPPTRR